jgi:hypothetical protein
MNKEPIKFYQMTNGGRLMYYPLNDAAKSLLEDGRKTIDFGRIAKAAKDGLPLQMRFHDGQGKARFMDWTIAPDSN